MISGLIYCFAVLFAIIWMLCLAGLISALIEKLFATRKLKEIKRVIANRKSRLWRC